jgi:hypothetical protein
MRRIRSKLTYANVISTLTLFLVLGGGTALAAVMITSNGQVGQGVISGHKPPNGKHPNIISGSINGQDIADRSGVETCQRPLVRRFGAICEGSDGGSRDWRAASDYCTKYGLRLPTLGEALAMVRNHLVDGVNSGDYFWTDDVFINSDGYLEALTVGDYATPGTFVGSGLFSDSHKTVCVTDPSA